jgi:hypothetical protein
MPAEFDPHAVRHRPACALRLERIGGKQDAEECGA